MVPKINYGMVNNNVYLIVMIMMACCGLTFSCVTQSKVEYMQDTNKNIKAFAEAEFPDYRLKPNDELYIQINSLDEGAANVFSNASPQSTQGSLSPYGASLTSYSVNKNGMVLLPVLGNISVIGKTLSEFSNLLMDSLKHVLSQPVVTVKLVNRYITVLGEVKSPGHYSFSQEKVTVYDALGLAGDITDYGNRSKVILVRNEDGENIRINLDISTSDILASNYYNLRPNDLLYVKPLRNKFWGMRQFPFSILFSTVTTGLLVYNIFR